MKKFMKKTLEVLCRYTVIPETILWFFIPFLMGWGISRLFACGEVMINNVIITDINAVCGYLCSGIGALSYLFFKFLKK